MIRSGLPYGEDIISQVYEEGAVVDLSRVKFPTLNTTYDNMKAAITYLRNTGYKVQLDFSEMSYEQKKVFIKAYLDTNVAYDIPEVDDIWLRILFMCGYFNFEVENAIMNDLEINCFISEEKDYLRKLADFIISLPLYLVLRLDTNISTDGIEVVEDKVNTTNFINIIKRPEFEGLMLMSGGKPPKNYVNVFTLKNNELFEAIANTNFNVALTGMLSAKPEEFLEFLKCLTFGESVEEECQTLTSE